MHNVLKKDVIKLDYIAVILMILVSDTIIFRFALSPAISISIYFIFSLFYNSEKRFTSPRSNLVYILILLLFLLRSYILYPNLADNQIFGMALEAIGSYLIIKNIDYQNFKKIYLNLMVIICLYGLPIFMANQIGLNPGHLTSDGQFIVSYGVCLGWSTGYLNRFAGLFHESGACMIFLNLCFLIYFKEISDRNLTKKEKYKLLIIFISLIATKSTGGYLIFLIIALFALYSNISFKLFIPSTLLAVSFFFGIINSDVVQNKLSDDSSSNSKEMRMYENLSCILMIKDRPINGYGLGSEEFKKQAELDNNFGNSNGLLHVTASLGFLWLLVYLFFLYRAIKKLNFGLSTFLMMIPFILLECNERYIEYPISYIFLIQYGNYGVKKNRNGK